MEIEKLIEALRGKCAVCKRSSCNGKYWELSSCPVMCEAATALEQLQAENDRLKRERDAAVELLQGQCEACSHFLECDSEDEPCNSCNHIRFSGGEDHWQWLEAGEVKS